MLGVEQVFFTASKMERHQIVEYYLTVVGLGDAMHKKPAELSQGMRQRVGIARAFALAPKMLLLDEPFGMLDSLTRFELQQVLIELWRKDQKTALMVTHDVDEALFLSGPHRHDDQRAGGGGGRHSRSQLSPAAPSQGGFGSPGLLQIAGIFDDISWRSGAPKVCLRRSATGRPLIAISARADGVFGFARRNCRRYPGGLIFMSAPNFIDELLAEQQETSAVERFSRRHENREWPAQALYYRDLIPLTAPRPGEQYSFEVELDKCSGCKACVTACHSLNGLDDNESWRDVGILSSIDSGAPFQQTITTACHHCVDPACANGCPVLAYEKDPITGIVHHLDDQCIGCQYCVLKCPYDVPKYSASRGIVRKCDMCSSRLTAGEAPACVQSCPNEAIRITVVDQKEMSDQFRKDGGAIFLPGAPAGDYTVPTTLYRSGKKLPEGLVAGNHHDLRPQPAHFPLILMLLLTQTSVGIFFWNQVLTYSWPGALSLSNQKANLLAGLVAGVTGIAASVAHLGRPFQAWRSFLGLKKSWLSREIVVFGLYLGSAAAFVISVLLRPSSIGSLSSNLAALWTIFTGLVGVFCSVMVYHDTRRPFWHWSLAGAKFFGTTLALGAAVVLLNLRDQSGPQQFLGLLILLVCGAKLGWETRSFRGRRGTVDGIPSHPARIVSTTLKSAALFRFELGVAGGILAPAGLVLGGISGASLSVLEGLMLALLMGGEFLERYLFFTAVAPSRMPGGIAP